MKFFSFAVLIVTLGVTIEKYILVELVQKQQEDKVSSKTIQGNKNLYKDL